LTWINNGKEREIPRIGPLFASMKAVVRFVLIHGRAIA
jgi:hypothetical protein